MHDIHISIVSHGHWAMIAHLLKDLSGLKSVERFQLTITLNVSEKVDFNSQNYSFPIKFIENASPKGFGENHNAAFLHPPELDQREYFVVINPDVRISDDVFTQLNSLFMTDQQIGVLAPIVMNIEGKLEDSIRRIPRPWIIIKKVFGFKEFLPISDFQKMFAPDWVAGMFMMFRSDVFEEIQGFNSQYFLYYEDVDICSRLWLNGLKVAVAPSVSIVHDAQRDSHRSFKFLRWHLSSMLRFFLSRVFRQAYQFHKHREDVL